MTCPRCNGNIFRESDELLCLQCGYRQPVESLPPLADPQHAPKDDRQEPRKPKVREMNSDVLAWLELKALEEPGSRYERSAQRLRAAQAAANLDERSM